MRVWATVVALTTIVVFNFATFVADVLRDQQFTALLFGQIAGSVVGALALVFAVSQIWWARTGFRLGEDELELRRGVISTQVRSARYDRIQAVDVVEPFAPRLFGLAEVRVEAAGGSNSAIEIGYLTRPEAEAIRAEILQKIAPPEEPQGDYLVPPIPVARSLVGAGLRLSTLFALTWSLIPTVTDFSVTVILPVIVGFIPQIWRQIDQSWRYNATLDGDVLHLSYGLANRRTQAVPLDRIHAISLSQPVLWRLFGWWTVTVNIAGYGRESNKASGTSRLLPVGSYEQALQLIEAISPLPRELIVSPDWDLKSPRRARVASPIDASGQALALTPIGDFGDTTYATTSHGLLSRRVEFVEVPHIQEVTLRIGPVQRALKVASVRFDLVPGPVRMTARDLELHEAWELVEALSARELPPAAATRHPGSPTDATPHT
nr:PH domain-containing protein [Corynebacterium meitnerae]